MKEQVEMFCNAHSLGRPVEEPCPVSGGLLHTMYRVKTESGIYAVKVLNPEIMQRSEALQNMINSERVSHVLEAVVPVVVAKEFGGEHVVEFDGTWFMVFDWQEGASVFATDITVEHCAQIGKVLGKIHGSNVQIEGIERSAEVREVFAWEKLLEIWSTLSGNEGAYSEALIMLEEFLPELKELDKEVIVALGQLSVYQVISHRDLDPKNVMWQGNQPYLIDWEAAGYVNPYQELVEVLNYWIKDTDRIYNYEKFEALMENYAARIDLQYADWDAVLAAGFDGMLGWLEYNVKRAVGLVGSDEADRVAGMEQVCGTIAELKRQKAQIVQLKNWLGKL